MAIHGALRGQGRRERKVSFAIYLEPWHADVFDFFDLRKNHSKEEARARDLFYALWVPGLFMRRCTPSTRRGAATAAMLMPRSCCLSTSDE